MENFQLYSTNILLGGNMKWDLILDKSDKDLIVSDVYINPISQQGTKFYQTDYKLLDRNHVDNIVEFYKNYIGCFYNPYIDNQLSSIYPLLSNEKKNYNDTFFMGCRRALYEQYNKQYSFLLPLWIENVKNSIKIILTVKGQGLERSKTIYLYHNNPTKEMHISDKANKYFEEYFAKIGLINDGDDRVMNVDIDSREAYINGLNVESGEVVTKDVSLPLRNIYTCERPLMDVDSILLESWSNNHIIAKQLMNFNLCFNLEDVFEDIYLYDADPFITYQVFARVSIDENDIPLKDFYTNYTNIKKVPELKIRKYNGSNNKIENDDVEQYVFDYLSDNYYINYIDKNKIPIKYFHWSLIDNNDYIFNLYEGFSGVNNPGYYGDSHDLINDEKIFFDVIRFDNSNDYQNFLQLIDNNGYIANIPKADNWLHYNRFTEQCGCKLIGISLPDDVAFSRDSETPEENKRNYEFVIHDSKYSKYFFVKFYRNDNQMTELKAFSYKELIKELNSGSTEDTENRNLLKLYLESYQKSPSVKFFNSLKKSLYESPDKGSKEIDYYNDKKITTIFRFGGFIKPSFVDVGNNIYYKKNIEDNGQDFKKYASTKFTPIYPSIDYCAFDYIDLNYINISDKSKCLIKNFEYPWFNNGEVFYLEKNIEANNILGKDLDSTIKKLLNYTGSNNDLYKYIKSLYNIQYDLLESNLINNEINYKFNIKMNLK